MTCVAFYWKSPSSLFAIKINEIFKFCRTGKVKAISIVISCPALKMKCKDVSIFLVVVYQTWINTYSSQNTMIVGVTGVHPRMQQVRKCTHGVTIVTRSPEFDIWLWRVAPMRSELSGYNDMRGRDVWCLSSWVMTSCGRIPHVVARLAGNLPSGYSASSHF
jgi:hypothetical protein